MKKIPVSSIMGYAATAFVVVFVPLVLIPEQSRSGQFWHRILWTEVLVLLVWGGWIGFFQHSAGRRLQGDDFGGVLPPLGLTILAYAILSFAAMMVHTFFARGEPADRAHLAVQILLAGGLIVLVSFFIFSHRAAAEGTKRFQDRRLDPRPLAAYVGTLERVFRKHGQSSPDAGRMTDALRALREKLAYSLPSSGSIADNAEYLALAQDIQELATEISGRRPDDLSPEDARALAARSEDLLRRVSGIQTSLKRS